MRALKECCKGPALVVIDRLSMNESGYKNAILLLKANYSCPIKLSKAYYEQLEALPPALDLKSQHTTLDKLVAINRNLIDIQDKVCTRYHLRQFPQDLLLFLYTFSHISQIVYGELDDLFGTTPQPIQLSEWLRLGLEQTGFFLAQEPFRIRRLSLYLSKTIAKE